jgi:alpha-N-arabinofuranosidase
VQTTGLRIEPGFRYPAIKLSPVNEKDTSMKILETHFNPIRLGILLALTTAATSLSRAQTTNPVPVLQIKADQVAAHVSPMLYGLMTEEINYSYDGGLYAELVRNRTFKDNATNAVHWQVVLNTGGDGSISLDTNQPMNAALTTSLKLEVTQAARDQSVGIANDGYWGIPVKPETKYRASFYAKADKGFTGPITVAIVNSNNASVYASATVRRITDKWQKYQVTLTTGKVAPSKDNRLVLSTTRPGTIWFNQVSLFPPTWNNRPNGNRIDIMQLLADMHPSFLRFPGGNYLQGGTIATRFDWKKTIGNISQRPGHLDDAWHYWSSDGMGLLEFLEWCEDLHIQPVLAVYAGYSLRGERVAPGPALEPYVKEALDEIEYVTGGAKTTWGARRAKDGHAAPFKLEYVEIGNEDNLERGEKTYEGRFAQFYDAIKAKHPHLKLICSGGRVKSRTPDVFDDHFYRNSMQMQSDTHHYDATDRNEPKIFVGEWATRMNQQVPTPNMECALGDAAWLTGLERNSDVVIMSCYAPLFVNVNPGGMQWRTDLIGYNALTSYASPAYYVQQMFSRNHGDVVLAATADSIPTREWQPPVRRGRAGADQQPPPPAPPSQQVPTLFYNATRDSKTGTIYLKVVNTADTPQPLRVQISGLSKIDSSGQAIVLSASSPTDTNSIDDPTKIAPVTSKVNGLGKDFRRTFPPYSITVLQVKGR